MTRRNPNFNGTGLSPEHVGSVAADNLDVLRADLSDEGEAGGGAAADTFRVTAQVVDANDNPVKESVRLEMQMHDTDLEPTGTAAFTITAVTGTAWSNDGGAGLVIDTDAEGKAVVDILDATGSLAADGFLRVAPVNASGEARWHQMTWA